MLMAVSCLSPVSTQILIPAMAKLAIVWETPSYTKNKRYTYVLDVGTTIVLVLRHNMGILLSQPSLQSQVLPTSAVWLIAILSP